MDTETKERLVAELRDYLDALPSTPAVEPAVTRKVDLYSLFTELAGLRNEVRLESRQIKAALDEFRGVFATLEASSKRLQDELDDRRDRETAAVANAERVLLLDLVTLRDRVDQARRLAGGGRPLRRWSLRRRESGLIGGLAEGLGITLRRLDQSLAAHRVTAVPTVGRPLDPHTMRVTAVRADPDQPDAVVLEETLRGYLRVGQVLRLAEVIANKIESSP